MLRAHRDILSDDQKAAKEEEDKCPNTGHVAFLTGAYKPAFYWFEVRQVPILFIYFLVKTLSLNLNLK
jgi:hypothetical protein